MSTATDSAQARDQVEQAAYLAAWTALNSYGQQTFNDADDDELSVASRALAVAVFLRILRWVGSDVDPERWATATQRGEERRIQNLADEMEYDLRRYVQDHAITMRRRLKTGEDISSEADPLRPEAEIVRTIRANDPWAKAVARTVATEAITKAVMEMVPIIDQVTGKRHRIMWVSRGDERVRKNHWRAHGEVRRVGQPFYSADGIPVRYPGDPKAPAAERYNCRCSLLLVASQEQARDLNNVVRAQALVAGAPLLHCQDWLDELSGKVRPVTAAGKYDHITFRPPEGAAEEARRGLEWRRKHRRGGTAVGVARARDVAARRNLSPETVRRMRSFFARHAVDSDGEGWSPGERGYPSAGRIAWALWGGDAGRAWAEKVTRQMDTADE